MASSLRARSGVHGLLWATLSLGAVSFGAVSFAAFAVGCGEERQDATPEGALTGFLDAIERSGDSRGALEQAYGLIDASAQERLVDRARSATALGARELNPWELLVEGRALLRFHPRRGGGMRSQVTGDRAVVTVVGEDGDERAEVPMVRQADGWRVVLEVPEFRAHPDDGPVD